MVRSVRAAGMVMGGLPSQSPREHQRGASEILNSYAQAGIGAYLFPGFLVKEPEKLASIVETARRIAESAGLGRPLIAIGGNEEPAFGFPPFSLAPSPLGLASEGSAKAAARAGLLLGSVLASCGVDMVLAPRLDLASDPKDPIGALEGFGEDSRLAGILGSAYVRGLARAGVGACIGRFPGLGATCRDCYEGMAFVALPVERLEHCEMRPFARAIASGVSAVLVGRVLVPALESEHIPAPSSSRIIEGWLRESLGFRGIVIGDDVGSGDAPGKAAVLGALAGCDLCLFSRPEDALAASEALEKASVSGELPIVRIEKGCRRIEFFLSGRRMGNSHPGSPPKGLLRKAKRDMEEGVGILRGHLALDVTSGEDYGSTFILVFMPPHDAPDYTESDAVLAALRFELPGANILGMPADPGQSAADTLTKRIAPRGRYANSAVLTYDAHFRPAQEGIARLVEEFVPSVRIVAMRDPYDVAFFPSAIGLAAAYGFSEGCAIAVGRLLSGKSKARGGHPVEVIGLEV